MLSDLPPPVVEAAEACGDALIEMQAPLHTPAYAAAHLQRICLP